MAKVKKHCQGITVWSKLEKPTKILHFAFCNLRFVICTLRFALCTLQGRAVLRAEKESMKSAASGNSGGGLVSSPENHKSCKDHPDRDHEHGDLLEDGAEIFFEDVDEDPIAGQVDPQAHHLSPQ